jgi:hypothetical protein
LARCPPFGEGLAGKRLTSRWSRVGWGSSSSWPALSRHRCILGRNVNGAFAIKGPVPQDGVLLVDDSADSKWTLTIVGARLRQAGAGPVYPLVLLRRGGD